MSKRTWILCVSAVVGLVPTAAFAANTIVLGAVGSSAMFSISKNAALSQAGVSAATNAYQGSNAGNVQDGALLGDRGNLWVVWDNGAANDRKIWFYLQTDSTVGVRAYFNSATLSLTAPLPAPASGNTTMPADVQTSVNGFLFNAGMTDITPADAKVATTRLLQAGYGSSNPIRGLSSTAGTLSSSTPVTFNVGARPFYLQSIGASPVMVFVNKSLTGSGDFGSTDANNINRFTLAGYLDGSFRRTRDLMTPAGLPDISAPVFIREGLSGTYVTMEECIPQSVNTSQEKGILSNVNNPANETIPAFNLAAPATPLTRGGRVRAIGTGALVNAVNQTPNSLGYSFWSFTNFTAATSGNTKYLTVDGVDPVFDSYVDGSYPTSGGSVTFKNIRNGAYPIWSLLRACVVLNPSTDLQSFFGILTGLNAGGNFVAKNDLLVFRSHRATPDVTVPSNGNAGPNPEAGADAGGAVYAINADTDFYLDTGLQLVNRRIGGQSKIDGSKKQ